MIVLNVIPQSKMAISDLLTQLNLFEGSIVLEGLDCTGKSTVAELLTSNGKRLYLTPNRKHELPQVHHSGYDLITIGQYKAFFDLLVQGDAVMDRCHLSSYVFGNTSWADLSFCEENVLLKTPNLRGVYLYATDEVVKERMLIKGEPSHLFDQYKANKERYEEALKLTNIPFIKLDTSLTTI
jgi:thymidylate kinase